MIVDNYWCLVSIDEKRNQINSRLVCFPRVKTCFDALWILSHSAQNSQEVTIAQLSLLDICWLYPINEYLLFGVDLACASPSYVLELCNLFLAVVTVGDRRGFRREIFICPRLSLRDHLVNELLSANPRLAVHLSFLQVHRLRWLLRLWKVLRMGLYGV